MTTDTRIGSVGVRHADMARLERKLGPGIKAYINPAHTNQLFEKQDNEVKILGNEDESEDRPKLCPERVRRTSFSSVSSCKLLVVRRLLRIRLLPILYV